MARVTNGIVTFNDLIYMVANNNYVLKNTIPVSNKCCNAQDIEEHIYATVDDFGYTSNRRIPFQLIKQEIYLSTIAWFPTYTAQYFDFNIQYSGSWVITDNASWLSINVTSGTGNLTGNRLVVTQNNITSTRTGTMTITDASTGASNTITVTQDAFPPIATDPVSLGYHASNYTTSCGASRTTYYIPDGQTWQSASKLYGNSIGNVNPPSGWYAGERDNVFNPDMVRYWDSSAEAFSTYEDC